jgi:hypothetical protein
MAQEIINVGTAPNNGTGDPLRTSFQKVNTNFTSIMSNITYAAAYGVVADGVTDDTAAMNAAIAAAEANKRRIIYLPAASRDDGGIVITDELDVNIFTEEWGIIGQGSKMTSLVVSSFGRNKKLMNCPEQIPAHLMGFQIVGNGNIDDPMGIYLPEGSSYIIRDLSSSQLGNTFIYSSRPFNCVIDNCQIFFSGWQELWRNITSNVVIQGCNNVVFDTMNLFSWLSCAYTTFLYYYQNDSCFYDVLLVLFLFRI